MEFTDYRVGSSYEVCMYVLFNTCTIMLWLVLITLCVSFRHRNYLSSLLDGWNSLTALL